MIQVEFSVHDHAPVGFCISGHAGAGSAGRDIVCAAVSSAAYMAANTLTDVVGAQPDIALADGPVSYTHLMLDKTCLFVRLATLGRTDVACKARHKRL